MQLNLSESARLTTAEESRYRVKDANSLPRVSRIIALDDASAEALRALRNVPWSGARFLRYARSTPGSDGLPLLPLDAELEDFNGGAHRLSEEIRDADVIIMITTVGSAPEAAEVIGNVCLAAGKRASGLVRMSSDQVSELSATLLALRPYAAMLVVSSGDEYIAEMLSALRA